MDEKWIAFYSLASLTQERYLGEPDVVFKTMSMLKPYVSKYRK